MAMKFPPKPLFESRFKAILGEEGYAKFIEFCDMRLRRSLRVNTLKISVDDCVKRLSKKWQLTPVPWCPGGFFVTREDRIDIGNTAEYQLGYFYVQEAASMIPPLVLEPKPGETVLDMCASPGSKATQIAEMMHNKGVLVANDYKYSRLSALSINLQRCGVTNTIITLMEGQWFKGEMFDRILLDAPCSGTGAIRKSFKTLLIWNPRGIRSLAKTQKQLIRTAFAALKPGGVMVYSTCSIEPEENEGVIDHLLREFPNSRLEPIELPIKGAKPVMEFDGMKYNKEVSKCLRLWPQDNDTEGFFVAKIKKV